MSGSAHEPLPPELQALGDVLHKHRRELDAPALERVRLRAMGGARREAPRHRGFSMRSRLVVALTVAMLAVGSGSAIAGFAGSGGGFGGIFGGQNAGYHQYRHPCKHDDDFFDGGKCHHGPPGYHWYFIHGYCWLSDGHGGFTWGYGNGWVFK